MLRSLSVAVILFMGSANAQLDAETFLTPPKAVADLVTAPRHLNVTLSNLSPNGRLFLINRSAGMPTLAQLARPYLELGGEMVDPHAFRDRTINIRGLTGLELYDWQSGKRWAIDIPYGATVTAPEWSPDGNSIAFLANFDNGSRLYVADSASGKSRQIGRGTLLTTNSTKLQWSMVVRRLWQYSCRIVSGQLQERPKFQINQLSGLQTQRKTPSGHMPAC